MIYKSSNVLRKLILKQTTISLTNTDEFLKGNVFRDTITPHPLCALRLQWLLCVCLYFPWYPLSEVGPRQWFSIFWWLINKEKENEKECANAWNKDWTYSFKHCDSRNLRWQIKKQYKVPPRNENTRNENTTTTNDNINNKHNIDSKNYQTTTTNNVSV